MSLLMPPILCFQDENRVILCLTGLNYYGLLKPLFFVHLISMCMCSQCDSTSLPYKEVCVLEQCKHAESKEIASAVLVPLGGAYSSRHICSGGIALFTSIRRVYIVVNHK